MSTEKITYNISRLVTPLVGEDLHHPSLLMDIVRYNFRKADFLGLYDALMKMEWSDILEIHDVNDICAYFYDNIYEMFEIYVPKTKVVTTHFPLWYSSTTIKMIKKKNRIWKSYKISHILSCKEAARKLEEQIKIEIKKDFRNFQRSAEANMKSHPARFWSYVATKKGRTRIPGRMIYNGQPISTPRDIVNSFADCFSSLFEPASFVESRDGVFGCGNSRENTIADIGEDDGFENLGCSLRRSLSQI
ncbi:hypothetical protein Zmor_006273 [Zophobas morio]|uniref:Uncharacterized protein n=1 Tax=Zophobas morio TaxID=2755281 RepID=A0AA38MNE2_9CUCU|nr:hypothetical protein Zmor_006273 [Zophobas morio]